MINVDDIDFPELMDFIKQFQLAKNDIFSESGEDTQETIAIAVYLSQFDPSQIDHSLVQQIKEILSTLNG